MSHLIPLCHIPVLHKHVPNTVLKQQCRPVHSHSLASTVAWAQFELAPARLQLLTGYEPCTLTQTIHPLHLEDHQLCKHSSLLSKSSKSQNLCLGKQGAWLVLLPSLHWFGGCPPKSAAGQTFFWYFAPLRELKKPYWKTSNLITTLSTSISHHQLLFWPLNHPFVGPSGVKTSVDSGHLTSNYTVCVSASIFLFWKFVPTVQGHLVPGASNFAF